MMKFFKIVDINNNVFHLSANAVRSYAIEKKRNGRNPPHYDLTVVMTSIRSLDNESFGVVVDMCKEYVFGFESFEEAQSSISIVEI